MPRLFVAIDLPEPVKDDLLKLAPSFEGARWVGGPELHLTLRFLGEVDEAGCSRLAAALCGVRFAAFPLALSDVGHFPPGGRARVLWVGMQPSRELLLLQREIEAAVIGVGMPADERRFSPHITLARLKDPAVEAVLRFEKRHADFACTPFTVDRFILYSSVLTREGAIHKQEAVYPSLDAPTHSR